VNASAAIVFLIFRRTQVFGVDASLLVSDTNAVPAVTSEEGGGHRIELPSSDGPPAKQDEEEGDEECESQENPDHRASNLPRRHMVAARSR